MSQQLDSLYVGAFTCGSFSGPAGFVSNVQVAQGSAGNYIDATKVRHRRAITIADNYTSAAAAYRRVMHALHGLTGTVVACKAWVQQAIVGDPTITLKLRKNGTDTLSPDLVLTSGSGVAIQSAAGFTGTGLAQGDILEADVTINAGTGTMGKGLAIQIVIDEDPQ